VAPVDVAEDPRTARGRRHRGVRLLMTSALLLAACQLVAPPPTAPPSMAALVAPVVRPPSLTRSVHILGGTELAALTRSALERLFATRVGTDVRERIESGALGGPLTIVLNLRGDDFTPYRVPGEELGALIVFDAWTLPLVDTEVGRIPATRETVLAHELGHAVLKLRSEEQVIREVENPVRAELGLPLRVRF
jgi:hypothetical protein